MKKWIVRMVVVIGCALLICAAFLGIKKISKDTAEPVELSEAQKIITKDITSNYPVTPRAVVQYLNKIILCYYGGTIEDDELPQLTERARELFDEELKANNTKEEYFQSVQADIADYKDRNCTIIKANVCDTDDVKFLKDGEDEIAYVSASYFIKDNKQYNTTYQTYVLRKDEQGRWKILVFYKIDADEQGDR